WAATANAIECRIDHCTEVDRLRRGSHLVIAGELNKIIDQGGELRELAGDITEDLSTRGRGQHSGMLIDRKKFDIGPEAGQRRTQLMTRVGNQLSLALPGLGQ